MPDQPTRARAQAVVDPDMPMRPPGPAIDRTGIAAVAVGGFGGTLARYELAQAWTSRPHGFPLATFTVNLTGALVIGVVLVLLTEWRGRRPNRHLRPLLVTGVLGGWTTMSTFAVETSTLLRHGHPVTGVVYLAGALIASVAGVVLSTTVTRGALRRVFTGAATDQAAGR